MIPLYSIAQIRHIERQAIDLYKISAQCLMQRAGQAAFQHLQHQWPDAKRITVLCGKGNNAGDGLVLALLAQQAGLAVKVHMIDMHATFTEVSASIYQRCIDQGVALQSMDQFDPEQADILVDALLGIGMSGAPHDNYVQVIERMNNSARPILALDVPSGLQADTGCFTTAAVRAHSTITFIAHKRGFYTRKGVVCCGDIVLNDLGLPVEIFDSIPVEAELLSMADIKPDLPVPRQRDGHKGDYGHVLIVGGDYGMGGAVRMAAEAAMRMGAGLVTVATRPEHVSVVSGMRPEVMCQPVVEAKDLQPLLQRVNTIVVGPGLGKSAWAHSLLTTLLSASQPKVVDADALNLLSENPLSRNDWVLTPHPGEAARLLGKSCQSVQVDRFQAVLDLQQSYGGVVLLKGAGTLIRSSATPIKICGMGNPGMASGGMGDVLSGIIGGLLAQGLSLSQAVQAGVCVHAKAGDLAAATQGECGLLATDLFGYLQPLVN